jgi:hypothetical protein
MRVWQGNSEDFELVDDRSDRIDLCVREGAVPLDEFVGDGHLDHDGNIASAAYDVKNIVGESFGCSSRQP